jgi:hypothetical protein
MFLQECRMSKGTCGADIAGKLIANVWGSKAVSEIKLEELRCVVQAG